MSFHTAHAPAPWTRQTAPPRTPPKYPCKVCGVKGGAIKGHCIACWKIAHGQTPRVITQNRARTVAEVEALERLMEQAAPTPPRRVHPVRVVWGVEYEVVWP